MSEVLTRALLAPPGIGMVEVASAALVGRVPDCWPIRKIIGAIGSGVIEALLPPHSGPQLRMYAVPPSAEKTALMGRSKTSGAP